MRMKNHDEKIDTLIRNALQEKAGDYEVSDEVKERIDLKIREEKEKLDN